MKRRYGLAFEIFRDIRDIYRGPSRCYGQKNPPNLKTPLSLYVLYKHDENLTFSRGVFSFINNHETVQVFLPSEKNMNTAQKVSAKKVSGHKVSKIDNIGQKVSIQNYLNKDNEHNHFSYYIINSVVESKANRK